jgi:hypothetical protein
MNPFLAFRRWRARRYLWDHGTCPIHFEKLKVIGSGADIYQFCIACERELQKRVEEKVTAAKEILRSRP